MSKVIGAITARMASTRAPGKVLKILGGTKSTFEHHVERMQRISGLDGVFLATSTDPANRALIDVAEKLGIGWFAGAEQDIVDRHIQLLEREDAQAVIRATCDCPILDIESAGRFVEIFKADPHDYVYVSNMTMIQGTLTELISLAALKRVHEDYRGAAISQPIKEHLDAFKTRGIEIDQDLCRPEYRLTIDEQVDIDMIGKIYAALYTDGMPLDLREVYTWLDDNPQVGRMNMHVGVKGCEQASAALVSQSLYTITPSGKQFVVLDEQKRMVAPDDFLDAVAAMFPNAGKRIGPRI